MEALGSAFKKVSGDTLSVGECGQLLYAVGGSINWHSHSVGSLPRQVKSKNKPVRHDPGQGGPMGPWRGAERRGRGRLSSRALTMSLSTFPAFETVSVYSVSVWSI